MYKCRLCTRSTVTQTFAAKIRRATIAATQRPTAEVSLFAANEQFLSNKTPVHSTCSFVPVHALGRMDLRFGCFRSRNDVPATKKKPDVIQDPFLHISVTSPLVDRVRHPTLCPLSGIYLIIPREPRCCPKSMPHSAQCTGKRCKVFRGSDPLKEPIFPASLADSKRKVTFEAIQFVLDTSYTFN